MRDSGMTVQRIQKNILTLDTGKCNYKNIPIENRGYAQIIAVLDQACETSFTEGRKADK